MLVSDLIQLIPSDTKKIVQQTKDRYNTAVRNILRAETRLSFQKASDSDDRDDSAVSVKVDQIGLPESLREHAFPKEMELAAMLAPWQLHLRSLRASAAAVNRMPPEVTQKIQERKPETASRFGHLDMCVSLAEELLREAEKKDVLKEIFSVNKDVLGWYRYDVDKETETTGRGGITLYWGIIGLVASVLGVSVEAMTVKVMAHELAHAFTHLGFDIDGHRWSGAAFGGSDKGVQEGLAQYYTFRTMEKLEKRVPDCLRAYELVVPKQPPDYQVQVPWIDLLSPETVRVCLVRARKQGVVGLEEFDRELCAEEIKMRRSDGKTTEKFMEDLNKSREEFANPKKNEEKP